MSNLGGEKKIQNFQTQVCDWPICYSGNKLKNQKWKSRRSFKTKIEWLQFVPVIAQSTNWEQGLLADHNSILNLLHDTQENCQASLKICTPLLQIYLQIIVFQETFPKMSMRDLHFTKAAKQAWLLISQEAFATISYEIHFT